MLLISQDGGKMVHLPGAALRVVIAEDVSPVHKGRMEKGFFAENPDGCAVLAYQDGKTFTMGLYRNYGDGMDVIRAVATAYSDEKNVFCFPDAASRGGYGFVDLPDQERWDGTMRKAYRDHLSPYPEKFINPFTGHTDGEGEP